MNQCAAPLRGQLAGGILAKREVPQKGRARWAVWNVHSYYARRGSESFGATVHATQFLFPRQRIAVELDCFTGDEACDLVCGEMNRDVATPAKIEPPPDAHFGAGPQPGFTALNFGTGQYAATGTRPGSQRRHRHAVPRDVGQGKNRSSGEARR